MVSAEIPLYTAAYAALTTGAGAVALVAVGVVDPAGTSAETGGVTVAPSQTQARPYVEFGMITEVEALRSNVTRSGDLTLTCVARADTQGQAKRIAAILVERLTRRLALAGTPGDVATPYVTNARLELNGPTRREPGEPAVYSHPVRVRYAVHQSAPPTE